MGKICLKCGIEKSFDEFYFVKSTGRFMARCKACKIDYNCRERRNKTAVYMADYRERNRDKMRAQARQYKLENAAKIRIMLANRRAVKLKATPTWASKEKIAEFYFAADFLGMVTGEWHHVDHIVPLVGKSGKEQLVCGLHWEGNLQVLSGSENLRKKNIIWPDGPMMS